MTTETLKPTNKMINVDLTLFTGRQVFMFSTLLMLDFVADAVLDNTPKVTYWYLCAIFFSLSIFAVAWHMTKGGKVLPVLLDLCFYDVALQFFGLAMYVLQTNPAAPTPVPYHYLALTINWLKLTCMLWHLMSRSSWPVFGPFSYFNQRKNNHNWGNYWRSNWCGQRLRMKIFVYPLPFLYAWAAYFLLVIRDNYPIDIRPFVGVILAFVYMQQQKAHEVAAEQYEREATEKNILEQELAFSEEQEMFLPKDMDPEARELAQWLSADRVSGNQSPMPENKP